MITHLVEVSENRREHPAWRAPRGAEVEGNDVGAFQSFSCWNRTSLLPEQILSRQNIHPKKVFVRQVIPKTRVLDFLEINLPWLL